MSWSTKMRSHSSPLCMVDKANVEQFVMSVTDNWLMQRLFLVSVTLNTQIACVYSNECVDLVVLPKQNATTVSKDGSFMCTYIYIQQQLVVLLSPPVQSNDEVRARTHIQSQNNFRLEHSSWFGFNLESVASCEQSMAPKGWWWLEFQSNSLHQLARVQREKL